MKGKIISICRLHHAQFFPLVLQGILAFTMQHIRPDFPHIRSISGCIINIPFPIKIMNLRRPYMDTLRPLLVLPPKSMFLGFSQFLDCLRTSHDNFVIFRYRCCKIIHPICMFIHIWICPLFNKRLIVACFFVIILVHVFLPLPFFKRINLFFFSLVYININYYAIFNLVFIKILQFYLKFFVQYYTSYSGAKKL